MSTGTQRGRPPAADQWGTMKALGLISTQQASNYRRGYRLPRSADLVLWSERGITVRIEAGAIVLEFPGDD